MWIFLHTKKPGEREEWNNEFNSSFSRVPMVGEYLALSTDSPWYQVRLVVHTPFHCDCEAEVYAIEINHMEAMNQAFRDRRQGEAEEFMTTCADLRAKIDEPKQSLTD